MPRKEEDFPVATEEWGWRFHHVGIPTQEIPENSTYIEKFRFRVHGFDESPVGIEWMQFDEDSPFPNIIKNIPHLAFTVQNLEDEIQNRNLEILIAPNEPMNGLKVAMVQMDGAPVELMEFSMQSESH
ncbi:MAG: hypothetical protein MI717_00090 [Spirochaetales bacterium]|nr:hypothetical protein [Spirochaetales bacterium]